MREVLIVVGVALVGFAVYTMCKDKKQPEMKPLPKSNGDATNYTTPPAATPINGFADGPDAFLQTAVRRFDASENSTVSRPTTTIKVGINEPSDLQAVVFQ